MARDSSCSLIRRSAVSRLTVRTISSTRNGRRSVYTSPITSLDEMLDMPREKSTCRPGREVDSPRARAAAVVVPFRRIECCGRIAVLVVEFSDGDDERSSPIEVMVE